MFGLPVTKTEIAQNAARLAVSTVAAGVITNAVEEHTDIDTENNKFADIGCSAAGYLVGLKLQPVTDKIVETAASQLSRIRFKKNKPETVTEES